MVQQCIRKCDIDLRRDFYCNIILSGGSTLYQGAPPARRPVFAVDWATQATAHGY